MKQIYNFEAKLPPVINEKKIRAEMERRKVQWETAILAVSSLLILFCLFLISIPLYHITPVLAVACITYICTAITGGSVIILVFIQKRRSLIK